MLYTSETFIFGAHHDGLPLGLVFKDHECSPFTTPLFQEALKVSNEVEDIIIDLILAPARGFADVGGSEGVQ